ncbi:hypothetical protein INS49_011805 [Diaporthe citri]|uniref:uncharacterized protein n=1 Tax=Diaporthe citri TaxID=83186 RepID=UPI001C80C513|nr:uncharacterized protein INS49_011805 [Diaporthe citri]KAG6360739.1 hypothetical protein INS49_011805 [Diaporthe citri]
MKASSEEKQVRGDIADEATCAPLLLQPPNDDPALMIPKSCAAEDADIDREEHERNRAQAVEDEKAEEREGNASSIVGYHVKMRGPYPALALTDEATKTLVRGVAYEIKGSKEKDRLAAYETGNYREHKCLVCVDGGEQKVFGTTFVWAGDDALLKDGSFDLRDWQQMYSI